MANNTPKMAKNYADYKAIKKQYTQDTKKQERELLNEVRQNWDTFRTTWRYKEMLTERQKNKTKKEQRALILAKIKKEYDKRIADFLAECDRIAQAEPLTHLYISVDWVRSSTWGMNPHAEIIANDGRFTGRASGCGYDKLSAATADALNQSKSALKLIYNKYEEALRKDPKATKRDAVGYGSGYSKPYYEGGVGFSCHDSIFRNCGAIVHEWHEGKAWDSMRYTFPESKQQERRSNQ